MVLITCRRTQSLSSSATQNRVNSADITLWNRRCHVELIPVRIRNDAFWAEVNLTVPESLAHHLPENQDDQIALRIVTAGRPAVFFVHDQVDAQEVSSTTRFTFPVGHTCSLLTPSGNAFTTWMLQVDGEAQILSAQP